MRLNMKKILKKWDNTKDESDCFVNRMHTSGLAPYSENMLTADDRKKVFTGIIDGLIARYNWTLLGIESSKILMEKIRDAKPTSKEYAIMLIGDTLYDTRLVYDYIRHYQRANDVIHMFKIENEVDAPILLTTNREWYCVIAPRMEAGEYGYVEEPKATAPVLFKMDAYGKTAGKIEPKEEPMDFDDEPTFNPITGEFE